MKAVLYGRFSPRPDSTTTESIETQFERCRAFCTSQGWEVAGEFEDRAISGKSVDGREGLKNALGDVCRLKGVLVCYSLSRLSRSVKDAIAIVERLNKCGADLALLTSPVNTTTPQGKCVYTIFAAIDQMMRELQAELTSDSMKSHQARGRRMGRKDRLPYGKMLDPKDRKRIVDCPEEQYLIGIICNLYRLPRTYRGICRKLSESGYLCRGRPWHHSTISSILKAHAHP